MTVEETAELSLEHVLPDCVALQARASNVEGAGEIRIRDLVRNALRMRPTRIVIGEVRGGEALDMLLAMNTGHEGSLSTLHANSPRDALERLTLLASMAEERLTADALTRLVARTIELVVQLRFEPRSGRRRVGEHLRGHRDGGGRDHGQRAVDARRGRPTGSSGGASSPAAWTRWLRAMSPTPCPRRRGTPRVDPRGER